MGNIQSDNNDSSDSSSVSTAPSILTPDFNSDLNRFIDFMHNHHCKHDLECFSKCNSNCDCESCKSIKRETIFEEYTMYRKIGLKIENYSKLREIIAFNNNNFDDDDEDNFVNEYFFKEFSMPMCMHKGIDITLTLEHDGCLTISAEISQESSDSQNLSKELCICDFQCIPYKEKLRNSLPDCIDKMECVAILDENKTQTIEHDDYNYEYESWKLTDIEDEFNESDDIYLMVKFDCTFLIKRNIVILYEDFLKKDMFNDISIICADNITVRANSIILSKYSPVFKVMLKGSMKETQTKEIKIDDIDSITMQEFINFLYTGKVKKIEDMLESLIYVAEKYDAKDLKSICLYQLHKKLSKETLWNTLKIADMYNAELLFFECIGFLFYSFSEVEDEEGYKNLNQHLKDKIIAQKESVFKELFFIYEPPNEDEEELPGETQGEQKSSESKEEQ